MLFGEKLLEWRVSYCCYAQYYLFCRSVKSPLLVPVITQLLTLVYILLESKLLVRVIWTLQDH